MNVFTGTGRLGNDAETRYTSNGNAVCGFSLAVDTGYGDNKGTLWLRCNLWGKRAEGGIVSYLTKGKQVAVSGELSERTWEQNGEERKTLELRIAELDLIGPKGDSPPAAQQSRPAQQQSGNFQQPAQDSFQDDIPF